MLVSCEKITYLNLQLMIYNKPKDKFPLELGTAFPIFSAFLTPAEKIAIGTTCTLLRGLIFRPHIWQSLQIKDAQSTSGWRLQFYLNWVGDFMDRMEPQQIVISMKEDQMEKQLVKKFLKPREYVKEVSIRSKLDQLHLAVSRSCMHLERISFHSNVISDFLLESMLKSCPKVSQIEINADALQFTAEGMQNYIKSPLQKLVLKPYQLNYSSLYYLLQKQKIDVEECDEDLLPMIIGELKKVRRLRLYHMQKFENAELIAQNLNEKLAQLVLTKCYKLNMEPLIRKIATKQLQSLDLTEAVYLNNDQILFLSYQAVNLKSINLSWCNELSNDSIRSVVQKCVLLQKCVLNGIKSLTDEAFSQYVVLKQQFNEKEYEQIRYKFKKQFKDQKCMKSEQFSSEFVQKYSFDRFFVNKNIETTTLRNLKHLECNSCNRVSDTILKIIYCFSRTITCSIINYYGQDLAIVNTNQLQDFDFY